MCVLAASCCSVQQPPAHADLGLHLQIMELASSLGPALRCESAVMWLCHITCMLAELCRAASSLSR